MQQMHEPPQPVAPVHSRRGPPRERTVSVGVPETWSPGDLEALLAAHHERLVEHIQQGVREIRETAGQLLTRVSPDEDAASPGDTARGLLVHVDERYQALTLRVERLEGALRQLVQTLKRMGARPGPAEGRAVEALGRRVDDLAAAVREGVTRQHHDLESFTRRTGQGLAQVAARAGKGLAQAARRQESFLDDRLEEMRQAIESLGGPAEDHEALGRTRRIPPAGGRSERPVSVFVDRLRTAEERLARASRNLEGWDPFAGVDPPVDPREEEGPAP